MTLKNNEISNKMGKNCIQKYTEQKRNKFCLINNNSIALNYIAWPKHIRTLTLSPVVLFINSLTHETAEYFAGILNNIKSYKF